MSTKDRRRERELIRQLRTEHHALTREHGEAKERVREYTARKYLSAGEEMECRLLQRIKLQKKDALHRLEQRLVTLEAGLAREDVA